MEGYASALREVLRQKKEALAAVEAALNDYELQCSREDSARRNVKAVDLPWG